MRSIYLDNSSAARPSAEAVSKMLNFYTEKWGTPTQPHKMGQEVVPAFQEAQKEVFNLLGASEQDTVIFTSSSAEAVEQAILSTYEEVSLVEGKNHFITVSTEDVSTLMTLQRQQKMGCAVTTLKPDSKGLISTQALIEAITPRTALLVISWANGLTGVVQPMEEIAQICQLRGIRLLVEGTHVLGKLFFELKTMAIDFLSFNGQPLHAPQGSGGLYVRQGIKISSSNCFNLPAMVGLGRAAKQALQARDYLCTEVARLKMHFEKQILNRIPAAKILFREEERVPNITCIAFPGIINEALLFLLNQAGVFASMGGGDQQSLKSILDFCGIDPLLSAGALSFSLSRETTEEELDLAINHLEVAYNKLRKASNKLVEVV